jgi:DNA-binding transcriptional MerR regulator
MSAALAIGDFSRATHMSAKTLRHYHRVGLLEPAEVDEHTGYRRYAAEQIPVAQVIRRFRALDMPLDEIRAVLEAPDLTTRNDLIAAHLRRLETTLARTQAAAESLRMLLEGPAQPPAIVHRSAPATPAAAITSMLDAADTGPWFAGALGELRATLEAQGVPAAGPPGGLYAVELFSEERGEATLFVPVDVEPRPTGRVAPVVLPATELAVAVHPGSHSDVDHTYGALAAYVAEHALGIDGPVRETYLVGRLDTAEASSWRTEIGWPIFRTRQDRAAV